MKIKKWEIALAIALLITLISGTAAGAEQTALSDKLVRLHVIANSDDPEDQALKLSVRDAVLAEVSDLLKGCNNRIEAERVISGNMDYIVLKAQETVYAAGEKYPVSAALGVEYYPTRQYDTFSLPAGEYMSLRVVIGEGDGRNWWCVVFPPLCVSAAENLRDDAAVDLSEEQISLITQENTGYVVRFRIIEFISKLKEIF